MNSNPCNFNVITWITEVETINGRPGLRTAVRCGPKSVGAGLTYGLRSVCDEQRRCSCSEQLVALHKCWALTPFLLRLDAYIVGDFPDELQFVDVEDFALFFVFVSLLRFLDSLRQQRHHELRFVNIMNLRLVACVRPIAKTLVLRCTHNADVQTRLNREIERSQWHNFVKENSIKFSHNNKNVSINNTLGYILYSIIALWWPPLCFYVLCDNVFICLLMCLSHTQCRRSNTLKRLLTYILT